MIMNVRSTCKVEDRHFPSPLQRRTRDEGGTAPVFDPQKQDRRGRPDPHRLPLSAGERGEHADDPAQTRHHSSSPRTSLRARILAAALGLALPPGLAAAQELKDVQAAKDPLILQEQGSFFVGGRTAHVDITGWDELGPDFAKAFGMPGDATVDQMYVQFQKAPGSEKHVPIIFVHGCCLSSKTWETTPDGRMGWYEYFTRKGYPTYLAEQSGRARSGFNATGFNQVRAGQMPPEQQRKMLLATHQFAWSIFRFGPKYGTAWPDEQFPIEKVDQLYKQVIPDLILTEVPSLGAEFTTPTTKNPTIDNMATLAGDLGGAILVGHSQSSGFPTQAALKQRPGVKGLIQLETGCFANLSDDQIKVLAKIPMLIVVGDHWDTPQPPPECVKERDQIDGAGGDFTFMSLPEKGLKGNSHMFMQDKNNLQVADLILDWIGRHVEHAAP